MLSSIKNVISDVLGFEALRGLPKDAILLMLTKAVRMYAWGFVAVILVMYLSEMGYSATQVGAIFTLTLLGDTIISLVLTTRADTWGRKLTLLVGASLSVVTSIVFSLSTNFVALVLSATIGVISPSGNEVGPFQAVELSALAQVTLDTHRTKLMAWYQLFGYYACAGGALTCGFIVHYLTVQQGYSLFLACRWAMIGYSATKLLLIYLILMLSHRIEVKVSPGEAFNKPAAATVSNPITLFLGLRQSKGIVLQLSVLFCLDAFGGSFVLQSIMCGWFYMQYGTSADKLGGMIFVCNLVAGVSVLFAAKLADRIGLVMTMVVTHLPSNVLLLMVPLMPNESAAIAVLCFRFCISQMDVPTRMAYVQGVVHPDERSAANGVTTVVRSLGMSAGPYCSGLLMNSRATMHWPWIIAGVLKIIYDILLLRGFRAVQTDVEKKEADKAAATAATAVRTSSGDDGGGDDDDDESHHTHTINGHVVNPLHHHHNTQLPIDDGSDSRISDTPDIIHDLFYANLTESNQEAMRVSYQRQLNVISIGNPLHHDNDNTQPPAAK